VPEKTRGYYERKGLIIQGKMKRESAGEGKTVSGIRHI